MAISSWGIDVSHSSIKAVKLQLGSEGIELAGVDVIEYPVLPDVQDADQIAVQVRTALAEFRAKNKPGRSIISCSLPSHSAFNRLVKIKPDIKDEELENNIKIQAEGNIPFPLDEVVWGYQFLEREYKPDEEREYILFAIKNDIINQFLEHIKTAKLNVDILQFAPVALYNFIIYQFADKNSVVLDLGSNNTDLIIIENQKEAKRVWIRNLPVAGNDFTKELQGKLHLNFAEAEKMKLSNQPDTMKEVYKTVLPLMKTLSVEINRSIGWYKSVYKTAQFESIVLTGSSSQIHGFSNFMHQSLQLKPLKIDSVEPLTIAASVDTAVLKRHMSSLGVAIGLALQGLGISENKVNLMPESILKRRKVMKKMPFVAAAVALLGLTVLTSYSNVKNNIDELERDKARMSEIQENISRNRDELNKAIAGIQPAIEGLTALARIGENRDLSMKVINAINAVAADIGSDAVIERFSTGVILKDDAQKAQVAKILLGHFSRVTAESRKFIKTGDRSVEAVAGFNAVLKELEKRADDELAAIMDSTQKDGYAKWKSGKRLWELIGSPTPVWILDIRAYQNSGQAQQADTFRVSIICAIEAQITGTATLDKLRKIFVDRMHAKIKEFSGRELVQEPGVSDLGKANYLEGLEPLETKEAGEKNRYYKYEVFFEIPLNTNGGI